MAVVLCLGSGCSSNISGNVFYDANANSARDAGEVGIGKAEYSVMRDNVAIGSGFTDASGNFSFSTGCKSGTYCVEIMKSSSKQVMGGGSSNKKSTGGKNMVAEGGWCSFDADCESGLTCQSGTCKQSGNGNVKEGGVCADDADCVSGLACSSGKCSKLGVGASCAGDADCATGLLCGSGGVCIDNGTTANEQTGSTTVVTSQPFEACVAVKNCSTTDSLDIPVVVDVDGSIAMAPDQGQKTVVAGSQFDLNIYYPSKCQLLPMTFPDGVESVLDSGTSVDLSLYQKDVNRDESSDIKSLSLDNDNLEMVTLKFKALTAPPGIDKTNLTVQFSPKAICPDNNTHNLKVSKFIIDYHAKKPLSITQKSTGKIDYGQKVTLITTVKNEGTAEFGGGASLTIAPPKYAKNISPGSGCDQLIQKVNCKVSKIAAGASASFSLTFVLPEAEGVDGEYEGLITTELSFIDGTPSIKPADIPITLAAPKSN
jgi:hypothetical protein